VSLDDYLSRTVAGQEAIYYVTAESYAAAKGSPQIEALRARGVEVLLMFDRIDEWMLGYLGEYAGKKLKNVAKGELDLDKLPLPEGVDKAAQEAANLAAEGVLKRVKELLGERVKEVRVSQRLTDSPACLVLDDYDMALHLQRVLREAGHDVPTAKPVLEINPAHVLVKRIEAETDNGRAGEFALLLLEQAQLLEGAQLEDPSAFVRRLNALLAG
jgi:molecular chaperone HtpG